MTDETGFSRRSLLIVGAGLLVGAAGCSSSSRTPSTPRSPTASSASSGVPPTKAAAALPTVLPWAVNANDIEPDAKTQAVRIIEALGNWPRGEGGISAARRRVAAVGQDAALASAGAGLLSDAPTAVLEVIDAQYGGLLASTASVLVVCRQVVESVNGSVVKGGTTVDVRLSKQGQRWRVTALHPARPGSPIRPLSRQGVKVLDHPNIALPPASEADIRSGQVHQTVLSTLLGLAGDHRIGVSVIRSGHPTYVFGTNRLSDHPRGRAFDTWQINGRAVVDKSTRERVVTGYMEALASLGSYNIGGPYRVSGSQFFSDNTHHDHVHAGFQT